MTRRRTTPQRPLPGLPVAPEGRDMTPVTLPMREVHRGTDAAWFLAPLGVDSGRAGFVARSICSRGEGPLASQFTMPRWAAKERGWLK